MKKSDREIYPNPAVRFVLVQVDFSGDAERLNQPSTIDHLQRELELPKVELGGAAHRTGASEEENRMFEASSDVDLLTVYPTGLYFATTRYRRYERLRTKIVMLADALGERVEVSFIRLRFLDEIRPPVSPETADEWSRYANLPMQVQLPIGNSRVAGIYGGYLLCSEDVPGRHLSLEWTTTNASGLPVEHPLFESYAVWDAEVLALDWDGSQSYADSAPRPRPADVLGDFDALHEEIKASFDALATDDLRNLMRNEGS